MSGSSFQLKAALRTYREGRLQEALQGFESCVAADPRSAVARGFRGLVRCHLGDFGRGLPDLREAVGIDPANVDMQTNLGMILFVLDRLDEALATLRHALVLAPSHPEALANLSLVLRAQGDFAGAERAARAALAVRPDFLEARVNLGYALLAQAKFAEGWAASSFRPPHHDALPAQPGAIIVRGEQGLGDTLFFLRFAPQLRARGHRLAFWGDGRLHSMLKRTGLFEHFMGPEATPGPGLMLIWAGDLPRLLGANDPGAFPAALPLVPDAVRSEKLRVQLAAWGSPPYLGLTWRAGLPRQGKVVLSKELEPLALGRALAGLSGTFVSVQRLPRAGELQALEQALGARLADASFVNDDLEDALAMMALLDDYVGVSNTNTHLRAGLGRGARVLVPWPPEWRWPPGAERSPWFAQMALYRQSPAGDWSGALEALGAGLTAR